MTRQHQRTEVPQEQRAQQRRDVLPVRVGVREDADLVIAQAVELVRAGIDAERDRDVMHFLRLQDLARVDFPGVQDLAAQRHDGLELAIARLLRRAAGGVAFDQEQLAALRILRRAVGELARQRRTADDALARDRLRCLQARLRAGDRELRDLLARLRMLVQPEAELILDDAGDERRRLRATTDAPSSGRRTAAPSSWSTARSSRRPRRLRARASGPSAADCGTRRTRGPRR